jgi:hypothetical protein
VGKFYPARPTAIRLANGTDQEVNVDFHHHHLAEDFRWQTPDRGLLQAVGRLRPHRRTEHCWLDVTAGVTMPIPPPSIQRGTICAPEGKKTGYDYL